MNLESEYQICPDKSASVMDSGSGRRDPISGGMGRAKMGTVFCRSSFAHRLSGAPLSKYSASESQRDAPPLTVADRIFS